MFKKLFHRKKWINVPYGTTPQDLEGKQVRILTGNGSGFIQRPFVFSREEYDLANLILDTPTRELHEMHTRFALLQVKK